MTLIVPDRLLLPAGHHARLALENVATSVRSSCDDPLVSIRRTEQRMRPASVSVRGHLGPGQSRQRRELALHGLHGTFGGGCQPFGPSQF